MSDLTTISIYKQDKERLEQKKKHPREPFKDVLKRILDAFSSR